MNDAQNSMAAIHLGDMDVVPISSLQECDRVSRTPGGICSVLNELSSAHILPDHSNTEPTLAQRTTEFWQWSYSIPAAQNPFNDTTGEFADVGQSGTVFFLASALFVPGGTDPAQPGTTRNIDVAAGKELFFPVLNTEWDNDQLQYYFKDYLTGLPDQGMLSPSELRNLNESSMKTATDMFCIIDGVTLFSDAAWEDPRVQPFRQVTPEPQGFSYTIPEDNVLGLPVTDTDKKRLITGAMSDGIWIDRKLSAGFHTLSFGGVFNNGKIKVDLDGDGTPNERGKEAAYQKAFRSLGTFEAGVNYNINQH